MLLKTVSIIFVIISSLVLISIGITSTTNTNTTTTTAFVQCTTLFQQLGMNPTLYQNTPNTSICFLNPPNAIHCPNSSYVEITIATPPNQNGNILVCSVKTSQINSFTNSGNQLPPSLPTNGHGQLQASLPTIPLSFIPNYFNPTPLSTIPITQQNTWIQSTYFSMNTNDYHGQFILSDPKTTSGIQTNGDELILIPLNLDIGIPSNYMWFQYSFRDDYQSNTNSYYTYGDMEIWDASQCVNIDPNQPRGGQNVVHDYLTSSSTPYTQPLQLSVGDSYHFDFYADQSKPNYMVFLLVDDTKGGISSGAFWWNEWQVPAIGLVYDPTCASPALFFEGHISLNELKISGFPITKFYINAGLTGNTLYSETGLKPLPSGITSQVISTGNGNFVWQVSSP